MQKNTGKKFITQGKPRENTGNFILAGMWPPCFLRGFQCSDFDKRNVFLAAVILMEGGTEFDLTVLDGPIQRYEQRSRTTSENQPGDR